MLAVLCTNSYVNPNVGFSNMSFKIRKTTTFIKTSIKYTKVRHEGPKEEHMYSSIRSLTSALDGVGGQRHALAALLPIKIRYPLYRRLSGFHGRFGRVRKIWSPPRFEPRTVHPVASRYTDYATPAHNWNTYALLNAVTLVFICNLAFKSLTSRYDAVSKLKRYFLLLRERRVFCTTCCFNLI
jgi:hypothetical protein